MQPLLKGCVKIGNDLSDIHPWIVELVNPFGADIHHSIQKQSRQRHFGEELFKLANQPNVGCLSLLKSRRFRSWNCRAMQSDVSKSATNAAHGNYRASAIALPGCRLDQHHGVEDLRPGPVQPNPEQPIGREEPRPAGALPAQDGHLMSEGDDLEFQRGAAAHPEREHGTEGGQKREHADDGMTGAPETLRLLGFGSSEQGQVPFECRSGVPIQRRLTAHFLQNAPIPIK